MKVKMTSPQGYNEVVSVTASVYLDIQVGTNERCLRIEPDGRVFDETNPDDHKEI